MARRSNGFVMTALLGSILLLCGVGVQLWQVCGKGRYVRQLQDRELKEYAELISVIRSIKRMIVQDKEKLLHEALTQGKAIERQYVSTSLRCGPWQVWPKAMKTPGLLCEVVAGQYVLRFVLC